MDLITRKMKRDGAQQGGGQWSSLTSSAAYLRLGTDEQWPQPATAPGNHSGSSSCPKFSTHRRPAPTPKSRGKVKGARKVRSCDVAVNHLLVSWRVVDGGVDGMVRAGVSASRIVGYLEGYPGERDDDDDDYDEEIEQDSAVGASGYHGEEAEMGCEVGETGGVDEEEVMAMGIEKDAGGDIGQGETGDMDFYHVGFVCDYVDEEDWCVVEEL